MIENVVAGDNGNETSRRLPASSFNHGLPIKEFPLTFCFLSLSHRDPSFETRTQELDETGGTADTIFLDHSAIW